MGLVIPDSSQEDEVLQLAMNFFRAAQLPYGEVSELKARSIIQNCCDKSSVDTVVIGWEDQGSLKGIIAGQVTEVLFNENRVATELIWWVEPAYRKTEVSSALLGAFEYWGEFRGCKYIQMAGLQNDYSKVLDRYYRKNKYVNSENTYVKEI